VAVGVWVGNYPSEALLICNCPIYQQPRPGLSAGQPPIKKYPDVKAAADTPPTSQQPGFHPQTRTAQRPPPYSRFLFFSKDKFLFYFLAILW